MSRGHVATQIAFLGLVFASIGLITDGCYALVASAVGTWLKRSVRYRQVERYVSGVLLVGLGLTAALAGDQRK
jgi:threonine/homoserine/homoserine lactone efflux protein